MIAPTISAEASCEDVNELSPTAREMASLFVQKYGPLETVGWAPSRRLRFGYFLPAEVYEALVNKCVVSEARWLDVGGGDAIFPENAGLARELVSRSARTVAIDPSDNVQQNEFVHERVQSTLEEFGADGVFDVATMRMVVEHVSDPNGFVNALARLVRPGGMVVVFTVNRWSPITLLSWLLPFRLHHPIKRLFWGGDEVDTFPVHYRMNTRRDLSRVFKLAGFDEQLFLYLDDLSVFGWFNWLNYLELILWRLMKGLGARYPENCILGVYRKSCGNSNVCQL